MRELNSPGVDPIFKEEDTAKNNQSKILNVFVYASNNPLIFVDPDGKDVFILVDNSGRDIDPASISTRKKGIESLPHFDPERDHVYTLSVYNLGRLEEHIKATIDDAKKNGYGKTVEVSFFGHSGRDGPAGLYETTGPFGRTSTYSGSFVPFEKFDRSLLVGLKQLTLAGWQKVDFNWKEGSKAFFWGCKAAAFAKKFLEIQETLSFSAGYRTSSYPSLKSGIMSNEDIDQKARDGWNIYNIGQSWGDRFGSKIRTNTNDKSKMTVFVRGGKTIKVWPGNVYGY